VVKAGKVRDDVKEAKGQDWVMEGAKFQEGVNVSR
jgi:hypothetical protein